MNSWWKTASNLSKQFLKIGFSPKASGFYPFGDATALAGEGGVGDVVWLIQASLKSDMPQH